jgi:hypothetical protein
MAATFPHRPFMTVKVTFSHKEEKKPRNKNETNPIFTISYRVFVCVCVCTEQQRLTQKNIREQKKACYCFLFLRKISRYTTISPLWMIFKVYKLQTKHSSNKVRHLEICVSVQYY